MGSPTLPDEYLPSMYASYLRERTNDLILEYEQGFATYRYLNNNTTVYIIDIFVNPASRESGIAASLANEIVKQAKLKGCKELIGSVVPSTKYSTRSLKVLLGYKMELSTASNDLIIFRKDI